MEITKIVEKNYFWGVNKFVLSIVKYCTNRHYKKKAKYPYDIYHLFKNCWINRLVIFVADPRLRMVDHQPTSNKEERLNWKLDILGKNQGRRSKECFVCSDKKKKKNQKRESEYHCETYKKNETAHRGLFWNIVT